MCVTLVITHSCSTHKQSGEILKDDEPEHIARSLGYTKCVETDCAKPNHTTSSCTKCHNLMGQLDVLSCN